MNKTFTSHKIYLNNHSGHKGVHWDESRSRWFAKININGTSLFLGRFKDFNDAVEARGKAETAISLLRSMEAISIHISSGKNCNKVIAGILHKNGFNFKVDIQLELVRTRDYSAVGGTL